MGHVIINLNSESGTLYGNSVVNEICWIENRLYKFKAFIEYDLRAFTAVVLNSYIAIFSICATHEMVAFPETVSNINNLVIEIIFPAFYKSKRISKR